MAMSSYYQIVDQYYTEDAPHMDKTQERNEVLARMRVDFRQLTEKHAFETALEVGFGTGIDLAYYGHQYPQKQFYGIDIAEGMVAATEQKLKRLKIENVEVFKGNVADLPGLFATQKFDLIYVYFGALNTQKDMEKTAEIFDGLLNKEGKLVLTFVNKKYLFHLFFFMLKIKPKQAIERFRKVWWGYSDKRNLPSKTYSIKQVAKLFSKQFRVVETKGYCTVHPAWYLQGINNRIKRWSHKLWAMDTRLNKMGVKGFGEYFAVVLQKR